MICPGGRSTDLVAHVPAGLVVAAVDDSASPLNEDETDVFVPAGYDSDGPLGLVDAAVDDAAVDVGPPGLVDAPVGDAAVDDGPPGLVDASVDDAAVDDGPPGLDAAVDDIDELPADFFCSGADAQAAIVALV